MGSSEENLIGQVLDRRYLIEKQLGVGGISAVYTARDLKVVGKSVVVKVLLKESYHNDYIVTKFKQEVEALSRVHHPNIVGVLDTGELPDGMPYIVLEFIEGISLRALIKGEGNDLARSARIIKQVGTALTTAHNKGIFHRDLKPENIMLQTLEDGEEQVKVIDFGIAKINDSVLAPETVIVATAGTIAYMSPEQLSESPVTAASDIYALGVVAFELITGRKPFNPKSPYQLLEMQRAGLPEMPKALRPSLPEGAQHALVRALAFDPKERYARARDFGDELYEAITGIPVGQTGRLDMANAGTVVFPTGYGDRTNAYATSAMSPDGRAATETSASRTGYQAATGMIPAAEHSVANAGATTAVSIDTTPKRSKTPLVILAAVIVFVGIAGALAFAGWKFMQARQGAAESEQVNAEATNVPAATPTTNANTTTAPDSPAATALSYSLTVQRVLDGKDYKEPLESTGQDIFENGWKFRLNVSSPKDGYLYLLNEGLNASGASAFTVLYPTGSSAQLAANQPLQIPSPPQWYEFTGQSGAEPEKIWFVWAKQPVPELEAVKSVIESESRGEITDPVQANSVQVFLTKHALSKAALEKDSVKKQTNVRGSGDLVVSLAELEHR